MRGRRVLVVGTNLAQDRILRLADLVPGSVLRARSVVVAPGGKAVNVARAARALGARPVLLASCPGDTGNRLAGELRAGGLDVVAVRTSGELRSAIVVLEDGGRTTVVNEPGPVLDDAGAGALVTAFDDALADRQPRVVVLSGSLPPGARDGLYADLVRRGRETGVLTVVDVGGAALAAVLAAGPALVKPNLAEAEAALSSTPHQVGPEAAAAVETVDESAADVPDRCAAAAAALVASGAGAALVSGGRAGAALHTAEGAWWFTAPQVEAVNPVGAGDALVAGVAVALDRGQPWVEAVRLGVASAADSVRRTEPAAVSEEAVTGLLPSVRVAMTGPGAT